MSYEVLFSLLDGYPSLALVRYICFMIYLFGTVAVDSKKNVKGMILLGMQSSLSQQKLFGVLHKTVDIWYLK